MAKRSRIAARPGQRRPLQRPASRSDSGAATRPANSLTAQEEARAAELEAAIVAEEKAAEAARRSRESLSRRPNEISTPRTSYTAVPLAVRAAEEYAYVRRDIRRITIVGGGLLLVLAVLEVLVNGMHLFTL